MNRGGGEGKKKKQTNRYCCDESDSNYYTNFYTRRRVGIQNGADVSSKIFSFLSLSLGFPPFLHYSLSRVDFPTQSAGPHDMKPPKKKQRKKHEKKKNSAALTLDAGRLGGLLVHALVSSRHAALVNPALLLSPASVLVGCGVWRLRVNRIKILSE